MSFVGHFNQLPIDALRHRARDASAAEASAALAKRDLRLADLAALLSPAAPLEPLAKRAHQLTQQRFGKVIRLFAPLYLSNECCLLYTSPSPRDKRQSRMPSSA